jgi:hypothetical protein
MKPFHTAEMEPFHTAEWNRSIPFHLVLEPNTPLMDHKKGAVQLQHVKNTSMPVGKKGIKNQCNDTLL